RRHTRFSRDWSSDVCSSDLAQRQCGLLLGCLFTVKLSSDVVIVGEEAPEQQAALPLRMDIDVVVGQEELSFSGFGLTAEVAGGRSEERRVGKECCGWVGRER